MQLEQARLRRIKQKTVDKKVLIEKTLVQGKARADISQTITILKQN